MKNYAYLLLLIGLFSSCMTNKRLEIKVAKAYHKTMPRVDIKSKTIIEKTDSLKFPTGFGKAWQIHSYVIPAIIYWNITQHLGFQMNDSIALSFFNTRVNERMPEIESVLKGRTLEISFNNFPGKWEVLQSEDIFYIFIPVTISRQYIDPIQGKLSFSYSIRNGDKVEKRGTIDIPEWNRRVTLNLSSTNRIISTYLGNFRLNMYTMADRSIDGILRDLKQ